MSTTPRNMDEGQAPADAPQQDATPLGGSAAAKLDPLADLAGPSAEDLEAIDNEPELAESGSDLNLAGADPAEAAQAESKPRPAPLATELQSRIDELNGQLLRALAEVDNVRKRSERMVGDAHKYAVANFAKDLLCVPDNLKRAMDAVPEGARSGDGLVAKLLEGVSAVDRELAAAFEKHGLVKLEPMDVPFDPNFHEAVYEVPESGRPPGTVVQLLQPGYTLHGRLIRAAMVGVSKGDGSPPEHKVDTTA